jgi:hypothetical protein
VLEIDGSGRPLLAGAGGVTGAAGYAGEYRFDRLDVLHGAGLLAHDRVLVGEMEIGGAAELSGPVVADDLTVLATAVVKPAEGDTLRLEVPGTLTIEATAALDVSHLGYPGGNSSHPAGWAPPLVAGSQPDAGGSHGGLGVGWTTSGPAGETYDSVYAPWMAGAGGSRDDDGSGDGWQGGGVVSVTAGELALDGEIRAYGRNSDDTGNPSGAGGTVVLDVGTLSGDGLILANGGRGRSCTSSRNVGSGGGGRVAIGAGLLSGFDPATQIRVYGGANKNCSWAYLKSAGAGTAYVLTPGGTYGDLYVGMYTEASATVATTLLPAVGTGVVGVTVDAADPADLWIEPQDSETLFDLGLEGVWVRIGSVDYRVLAQTPDRRQLLLAGAAGAVAVGDAYEGVYKFDTVTVTGGAVLEIRDRSEIGTLFVDPGSTFIDSSGP